MKRLDPIWLIVGIFILVAGGLFIYHQATGATPPRIAFSIFGLDVFWYGIWIIAGIGAGAFVVSRLALERATAVFEATVPENVQKRPLTATGLSEDMVASLAKVGITRLGDLLFQWGLDPRRSGLKKEELAQLGPELAEIEGVEPEWLVDAPWEQWNPDHVWNALILILILGLIGARLYHVLTPSPSMQAVGIYSALDYFRNPFQLINLRGGGLGIYGGILGGLLGLLIYTKRHHLSALAWADLAVVGMALGQAIGRWGNYFNQELYGRPTNLPWAILVDPIYRLPDYAGFETFHPAFLYESLWSLLTFFLLLWLVRRQSERLLVGEVMAVYFVAYAIGRSLLELVRLDSRTFNLLGLQTNLAIATVVSLLVAAGMVIWVVYRRWSMKRPPNDKVPRQVSAG